jgi:hypothetical protein
VLDGVSDHLNAGASSRLTDLEDDRPRTLNGDDRGYGLPLVTIDLESMAEDLVARCASRRGIEQAFANACCRESSTP